MPLLVLCGYPSSGKTTITNRIVEDLKERGFNDVVVVSDRSINDNFSKNSYNNFKQEKENRNALRSTVQRFLDKKTFVICDSLNYVKGFRYELFCLAKNSETTYAVLFLEANADTCCWLNSFSDKESQYPHELLYDLVNRFEKPNIKNRWDSPLFSIEIKGNQEPKTIKLDDPDTLSVQQIEESLNDYETEIKSLRVEDPSVPGDFIPQTVHLPLDELYSCLVKGKNMKANQSTKTLTPKTTSVLSYNIDQSTQRLVNRLLELQPTALPGDQLIVNNSPEYKINFLRQRNLPELQRLRKQFINYIKMHPSDDSDSICSMFVDFLNNCP